MTKNAKIIFLPLRKDLPNGSHYGDGLIEAHRILMNNYVAQHPEISKNSKKNILVSTGRGIVGDLWESSNTDNVCPIDVPEDNIIIIDWNKDICDRIIEGIEAQPERFKGKKIIVAHASFTDLDQINKIIVRAKSEFKGATISRFDLTNIPIPCPESEIIDKIGFAETTEELNIFLKPYKQQWRDAFERWSQEGMIDEKTHIFRTFQRPQVLSELLSKKLNIADDQGTIKPANENKTTTTPDSNNVSCFGYAQKLFSSCMPFLRT